MKVIDHIKNSKGKTQFTFEILPPVKGYHINSIFDNVECIYHKAKNTKILTHLKTNILSINKKVGTSSKKMKNLV